MKSLFLILSLVFSSVIFAQVPVSVSVKTASYTIPSGKFAKVYVECDSGGTFTINGSTAMDTDAFVNVDASGTGATSYTVPANYRALIAGNASVSGEVFAVNGNTGETTVTGGKHITGLNIGPAGTAIFTAVSASTRSISGVAIPSNATNRNANFTLPAGTVLNGTGNWRATVELYER